MSYQYRLFYTHEGFIHPSNIHGIVSIVKYAIGGTGPPQHYYGLINMLTDYTGEEQYKYLTMITGNGTVISFVNWRLLIPPS